jgi:hypothetical protein
MNITTSTAGKPTASSLEERTILARFATGTLYTTCHGMTAFSHGAFAL